ncbi:hypothetical protein LCGC14_1153980 [marine sediment metagenome]|uniref:Uncharacterized protein n=1 Tax=marine sediment metagenome TaxID=412755 RepID=A0A0F9LZK7_9ZZZZ
MENFKNHINQTKKWMKQFAPETLLKWVQTCSIYRGNQKYQLRFELLLAIILSIKEDDFEYEELGYDDFKEFITNFKDKTNHISIEDFYIFDQLNLIPYFYRKRKYYFFNGITERPYESLRILDWIFLLARQSPSSELSLIHHLFLQSLIFQTRLLVDLKHEFINDSYEIDDFQVPPQNFLKKFCSQFLVPISVSNDKFVLKLGETSFETQEDLKKLIDGDYFKHLYIKTSKDQFFMLPQLHIELLPSIFLDIIINSSDTEKLTSNIIRNLISRFRFYCGRFFSPNNLIIAIGNKTERFSKNIDLLILFDDYLLLFKLVNPLSKEISEGINEAHELLEHCVKRIQNEEDVYFAVDENKSYKIPTKELHIVTITIFESIRSGFHQIKMNFRTDFSKQLFSLRDLIAMFELLPSKHSFIKYLQEREQYREKFFNVNGINILALYLMNNESIPDSGEDKIFLYPHFWIDYYSKHLFDKYKDNIYELVEKDYPHRYNLVKKWNQDRDLYECIDTYTLQGANIIKTENKLIWVFNPSQHQNLDHEDFRFAMRVIGPMYSDYLQRILTPLNELMASYSGYTLHGLYLIPLRMCENNPQVEKFKEIWLKVDLNNPIIVTSFVNADLKLISLIFYDFKLWCEKFNNSQKNDNCRYAIAQFIISIIDLNEAKQSEKEKVDKMEKFLRLHFKESEKDYIVLETPTWNPQIILYPACQKVHQGDQEMVIKQVEEYFRVNQIEKRTYTPEESKDIYNEVYHFLYNKFREKTSSNDLSLLLRAYAELELIEARRYHLLMETGMKSDELLDSDYLRYFRKELKEIMNLSGSTRFLIESILNFGLADGKRINAIDYGYLQALSSYLVIISQKSDFTHSEVLDNLIQIKDNYKFDEIQEPSTFNYDNYIDKKFNGKIKLSRSLLESEINQGLKVDKMQLTLDGEEMEILMVLENAFLEEFKFTYTDMMRVLFILSTSEFTSIEQGFFPLIRIEYENLKNKILKDYKIQFEGITDILGSKSASITEVVIRNIINFISLDFNIYKDEEILLQFKLLKKKERLTICPLIKLNKDDEYIFGYECCHLSFNLWRHYVLSGVFPYFISANSSLSRALSLIHTYRDKNFEDLCGDIAKDVLGEKNCILRLKKFNTISKELPKNPDCGEIDLLAVNPIIKIIFVLDAKNYYLKFHPYDIKNQINRILTSENSDFVKLKKKEEFVSDNLDLFLEYFQINDKLEWTIKKGFVIRHNFPTAHVPNYNVDFVFEEDLKDYLRKR